MIKPLKNLWRNIRRLSGDDAYEQYLAHYAQHQAALDAEKYRATTQSRGFF